MKVLVAPEELLAAIECAVVLCPVPGQGAPR